ncbi:MAG: TRAM domain-containing protein [Acidobacteria bacterium]|nr:TRAM domain-containing protein [Acidobacteriota bacterium]
MNFDVNLIRCVFVLIFAGASCYFQQPVSGSSVLSGLVGLILATGIIFFETRIRRASIKTLIGGAIGSILGIIGACLIGFLISVQGEIPHQIKSYITFLLIMFMAYIGLIVGAIKGDYLDLSILGGLFRTDGTTKTQHLILDTSVIIDGRVADVAETGFLGGQLVVPQFMLRELQQVADSADSAKRNRGRRGLDILQRIQKNHNLDVQVSDIDFPDIREVDHKLIELAKQLNGKIVTNDFNLNKVAQLRGVPVLNINELANALKPVVLPGELMKVFVLKEGKEYNQGVAYLDDGTMVVIDNARRSIGKNVEISVTSVLQTTAGKMIFGRYAGEDGRSTPPDGRVITDRSTPPDGRVILDSRSIPNHDPRSIHNERPISEIRNIVEGREPRDIRSSSSTPSPNSAKFRIDG